MTRAMTACLRFVAAFLVVALAIGRALPLPEDYLLDARLEHLRNDAEGYDAVIVGSSVMYRGLDPGVIDEVLAREGFPLRTYNLAAPGCRTWEVDVLIRAAVDAMGDRLKYVVLEPGLWHPGREWDREYAYRYMYWHTPRATLESMLVTAEVDQSWVEKIGTAWMHLRLGARRAVGYGCFPELRRAYLDREPIAPALLEAARDGGFLALDDDPDETVTQRRTAFVEHKVEGYLEEVAELRRLRNRRAPARPNESDVVGSWVHRRQVEEIEGMGMRPVFVVAPYSRADRAIPPLERSGEIDDLLVFALPDRFPDLYALSKRWDENHLDAEGARLFSAYFAREFARLLRDGGPQRGAKGK
ncbi:MAG: hypothetical protein R3F34_11350 [Planctomycetota bacterium]